MPWRRSAKPVEPHPDERWGVARNGRPLCAKPKLGFWREALILLLVLGALYLLIGGMMRFIPWRGWGWSGWGKLPRFGSFLGPIVFVTSRYFLYLRHNQKLVNSALETALASCLRCGYDLRHLGEAGRCPECGQEFECNELRRLWNAWLSSTRMEHDFHDQVETHLARLGRTRCLRCGDLLPQKGGDCSACMKERGG